MSDGFVASGKRLCGAIDLSVVRSFGEEHLVPKGGKSGPKGVKHEFIQRYLTEKDWSVLGSQSFDMTSKIRTVIQRCKLMGLKSMCEQTAKRVAALLKLAFAHWASRPDQPRPCGVSLALALLYARFVYSGFSSDFRGSRVASCAEVPWPGDGHQVYAEAGLERKLHGTLGYYGLPSRST